MCASCGYKVVQTSHLQPGVVGIPLNGVMNDNFASLLSWAYCINPDKVKFAFKSSTGLDISESEFANLAKIHANGNDVKGYGVNFLNVINGISFTHAERSNASCPYNFTR